MSGNLEGQKLRLQVYKHEDLSPIYADGAFIKPANGRALILDFFSGEYPYVDQTGRLKADGTGDAIVNEVPEEFIYIRTIHSSIVLTLENAEVLKNQLEENIKALKAQIKVD